MKRYLAESEKYKVVSDHESVYLEFKNEIRSSILIGDFYGNPECAIISIGEKYVVMAGYGIIVYRLEEPFAEYQYNTLSKQYYEMHREPKDNWWVMGLHQVSNDYEDRFFRFVKASGKTNGYEVMRFDTATRLIDIPN